MEKSLYNNLLDKEIIPAMTKMREAGQKEYAHDIKNVFANFERTASILSIKREKVLMAHFLKHIDGIMAHIEGHKSQRESVTGRITDALVYLTLLWGMLIEEDSKIDMNVHSFSHPLKNNKNETKS